MQAIYQLSNLVFQYGVNAEAEIRSSLRISTYALAGVLFLTASVPVIGWNSSEIVSMEDSHQDISLAAAVTRFQERLPKSQKAHAYRYAKKLFQLSDRYMFSPGLLLSVIETESSFRPNVVSKAGAIGLMQLLPGTAHEVARMYKVHAYKNSNDLYNPILNMELGTAYLAYLRGRFGHSVHYLAAYNLGPSALRARLKKGNYELGAIEAYVRKIQDRTMELREQEGLSSYLPVRSLTRIKNITAAL